MCLYKFLLLLSLFNILRKWINLKTIWFESIIYFIHVSGTHDVLRENLLNEKLKSIPVNFKDANLNQSNVTFKLFVKSEEIKGRILDGQKINKIVLNRDLPAKFFIHGFRSNSSVKWYQLLKDVYFKRAPYNIFYVDWSKGAYKSYNVSAANVKPAGEAVGDFIMKSLISFENVHLIGDGLGAMVAGFAGKRVVEKTRKKLHRITATDPSAAKFEHRQVTKRMRLSEIDATFVECIHTDVGGLGFTDTVGHADFYPNGGFAQPECVVLPEEGQY